MCPNVSFLASLIPKSAFSCNGLVPSGSLSLYVCVCVCLCGLLEFWEKKSIVKGITKSSRNKQMAKIQGAPTTPMTYGNSNISPWKNIILKKKSSKKKTQNPSRNYNSIHNLKFWHKPKYHLSSILNRKIDLIT
jgi:hypothetical protein